MYRLLRSILFFFPPEWVHYFSMNCLRLLCTIGLRKFITWLYRPKGNVEPCLPAGRCSLFNRAGRQAGLQFSNPVGLGAGFDKNAKYLGELECLGFGFVETGTVTPLPQSGNDKPRLFRLPKDKALVNRMGFNNDGVKVVAERLKKWRERQESGVRSPEPASRLKNTQLIIGGNIGKNKATPNEDAWKD